MIVRNAANTFFEGLPAEVDEQTEREPQQAKIGQYLFAVQRRKPLHGFQFDEQFFFDQKISAKTFGQFNTTITDGDGRLSLNIKTTAHKLVEQNRFVDRFEQPRPQIPV